MWLIFQTMNPVRSNINGFHHQVAQISGLENWLIPGKEFNEFELLRCSTYLWFKFEPPIQSLGLRK